MEAGQPKVASSSITTQTEVLPSTAAQQTSNSTTEPATLRLRLQTTGKKVSFNAGTVDNENMNKKKSKCCCIFKKPLEFGESSSEEDEDECDNCFGHVEKKKNKKLKDPDENGDRMQESQ